MVGYLNLIQLVTSYNSKEKHTIQTDLKIIEEKIFNILKNEVQSVILMSV